MADNTEAQTATTTTQPIPETRIDALEAAAERMLAAEGASPDQSSRPAEQQEPQTTEAAVTKPAEQPKPDRLSRRYLEIQKKERDLAKREKELRAKEPAKQAEAPKQPSIEQLQRLAKANPNEFLKQFGIDAKYVNEFFLNQGPTQDVQMQLMKAEMEDRIREVDSKHETFTKQQREAADEQAIKGWQTYTSNALKANAEKFELLMDTSDDPISAIYDLVTGDYQRQIDEGVEEPKLLTPEEAAQHLEDDLMAQVEKLAQKKAVQKRFGLKQETKPASGILNQHQAQPGQAVSEKQVSEIETDDDPLEAAAKRELARMMAEGQSQVAQEPTTKVVITQGHMQQLPDRNSDRLEEEEYQRALEDIRQGRGLTII